MRLGALTRSVYLFRGDSLLVKRGGKGSRKSDLKTGQKKLDGLWGKGLKWSIWDFPGHCVRGNGQNDQIGLNSRGKAGSFLVIFGL